jgi:DNA-binding CsgD family transcriptional regulator
MSTAATLYAPGFPHGTVDGYRRGCHGSVCGALIACRDVYRRYQGDFTFRRQIDADVPVEEIYARDAAAADAARESDKAAARVERRRAAAAKRPKQPRPAGAPRAARTLTGPTALERHGDEITRLHAEGLSDQMIARDMGMSRSRVAQLRRALGLAPVEKERRERPARHSRAPRSSAAADVARLHAEGLRDIEIAERLELNVNYVGNLRRGQGLPLIPAPQRESTRRRYGKRRDRRPDVAAAHADGLTDREIGERLGMSPSEVGRLRRELGLASHRPAPRRRNPADLLPHGTNASYARGCRCDACHQAQREYYREWARKKRAQGIPAEHHGTPYGYQLGCRSRKACPAETTCTDASLAEERRRRREAGIPAAPDRADAAPVRAHVRALIDSGRSVLWIAQEADVSLSGIKTLIYGRSGARKGEFPAHIETAKATKLLALKGPNR